VNALSILRLTTAFLNICAAEEMASFPASRGAVAPHPDKLRLPPLVCPISFPILNDVTIP
jgi:hypothetical protein